VAVDLTKHATKRRMPAEYATRAIVTARGWTQTAISRFLAEPDGTLPNLRYRGSPPTRLYAMDRVRAVEGTREWQEWYLASQRRRSAAARAGAPRAAAGATAPGGHAKPATRTHAIAPTVADGSAASETGGGERPGLPRSTRATAPETATAYTAAPTVAHGYVEARAQGGAGVGRGIA